MRYELVWGHRDFYGMDETKIKSSSNLEFLEDALSVLVDLSDEDLMKYLDVDELVINEGVYFRIKIYENKR
jgi:hypothetical protein